MNTALIIGFVVYCLVQGISDYKFKNKMVKELEDIHMLLFSAEQKLQKSAGCGIVVKDDDRQITYFGKDVYQVEDLMIISDTKVSER